MLFGVYHGNILPSPVIVSLSALVLSVCSPSEQLTWQFLQWLCKIQMKGDTANWNSIPQKAANIHMLLSVLCYDEGPGADGDDYPKPSLYQQEKDGEEEERSHKLYIEMSSYQSGLSSLFGLSHQRLAPIHSSYSGCQMYLVWCEWFLVYSHT